MNHQELLSVVPARGRFFPDFKSPRFYSAWPYFILILATLLMGSARLSSQSRGSLGAIHIGKHRPFDLVEPNRIALS